MRTEAVVIGGVAVLAGVWLLTRGAGGPGNGDSCADIAPGVYHYFTYRGGRKTFRQALGDCYPVIFTIDVWSEFDQDWIPPTDPDNDILMPGSECRVMVQESCRLCRFEPEE